MTISITVSVNGNYKVPVKVQYEDVGPEEQDNGEEGQ